MYKLQLFAHGLPLALKHPLEHCTRFMIEYLANNEDFRRLVILNASLRDFGGRSGFRQVDVQSIRQDGRVMNYAPSGEIPHLLDRCLNRFQDNLAVAPDLAAVARATAEFWYTFTVIRPFNEGNAATAKLFLENTLAEKQFEIFTFELIDKHPLEGDAARDLASLITVFIVSMRAIGAQFRSLS